MCPACINSLVTGATVIGSTGGLVAVLFTKLGLKKMKPKENCDATSKSRV
jgi:hypothetical protein